MANENQPNPFLSALADEHRQWLMAHDRQYVQNWEKLLVDSTESALAEAGVRRWLEGQGVVVEPNEHLSGAEKRPDFRCLRNGEKFYVEVTHISKDKATEITGIPENGGSVLRPVPLNMAIFSICTKKAVQCSGRDAPVLVAIGTFHGAAAIFSFSPPWPDMILTGTTTMTVTIDKNTLESVGGINQFSELQAAAFLRFDEAEEIGFARSSISGLLLCGLSLEPTWVVGLLHPNPARPFDAKLLPGTAFGQVDVNHETGDLRACWPKGSD